jgi:NAD(P)-dependent dehydrogenase (short-subunit alcohol dehydrogenase family)
LKNTKKKQTKKVVLITGCTSDLGGALAESLVSRGYIVYAGAREPKTLRSDTALLHPVRLNVTIENECKDAVNKIIEEEGRIDVLINVAANSLAGPTIEFSEKEYLDILNINTIGAFRLIRLVCPHFISQRSGRIINITSINGLVALPNFGLYSSSKFAIEALGLSLRYELAKYGVWVTNVAPGAIASGDKVDSKKLPHKSAREKFWILRVLMPMVSRKKIVQKIIDTLDCHLPPARILLGTDAKIMYFLQRFLPQRVWDWLIRFIWNKK